MPLLRPALKGVLGAAPSRIPSIQLARTVAAPSFITRHGSVTTTRRASTESPASTRSPAKRAQDKGKYNFNKSPLFPETLPPHSPSFVLVPMPPQNSDCKLPPIKGHLPKPREIFTRRSGGGKAKGLNPEAYVAKIRPLSARQLARKEPRSDEEAARWRTTDLRRRNLVQGLRGLWNRKKPRTEAFFTRLRARANAHKAARHRPEPAHDVLTRGTVLRSTYSTEVPLDPHRFAKAEASRVRTAAIAEAKSAARRDALAQLYMAAEHFIVDEEELEARIDKLFVENHFPGFPHADNIWEYLGPPARLQDLLRFADRRSLGLLESAELASTRASRRQMVVSEELTGGKLEPGR